MFIFRKRNLSAVPNVNGTDVDFLSIPASSLVSMNMAQRQVILYFVNGNSYSKFTGGTTNIRGYEYAQVVLDVNLGDELLVIYEISNALSQDRSNITFDNVNEVFDIDRVNLISSIKRFESLSILDTDPASGGGGLPSGSADGEIIQWDTATADWIVSPYTLPTADGTANQVLQTDGSGAVTFEDLTPSKTFTISMGGRYTMSTPNEYYFYNGVYGWDFYDLSGRTPSFASLSYLVAYAGIVIPYDATEAKVVGTIRTGNTEDYTVELWSAPNPNGSTSSITPTSIASQSFTGASGAAVKIDFSATGLSLSSTDLLFLTYYRSTGATTTTRVYVSMTIALS